MVSSVSLDNTGNMTVGVLDEITYSPAVMGSVYIGGVNTSSTYLTAPSNSAFAFGTGDFTIEAWVYRIKDNGHDDSQASNFDQNIFDFRTNDSTAINIAYDGGLYGHTDKIYCIINGAYALVSTTSINAYTWYHVAVVRSGTTVTLYINGTAEATTTSSRNFATATPCKIGGRYVDLYTSNSSDWRTWQGYLTGVRVVKGNAVYTSNFTPSVYPLTAVTGTSLLLNFLEYNNYLTDSSTNNFTVTSTDSVQYRFSPAMPDGNISSYFGKGINSAFLGVASNSAFGFGTGDYTVEGWFYKNETQGPNGGNGSAPAQALFDFRVIGGVAYFDSLAAQNALYIYQTNSTKKISVLVNGSVVITSTATIELNTWYHIAYVRSGTNEYLFINGTLDSTRSSATTNYVDSPILIGGVCAQKNGSGSTYGTWEDYYAWRGYVTNVRVVKGTALYTSSFTPPTTALKAISGTSLLACQTANKNKDNSTNNFTVYEPRKSQTGRTTYVSSADSTPFNNMNYSNSGLSVQKQYSNGTVQVAGVFDEVNISPSSYGSLSFNGTSQYLSIASNTAFDFSTADFTIEAFINPSTLVPGGGTIDVSTIIAAFPASGTITGWGLGYNPSGYIYFTAWVSGTQQAIIATSNPVSTNTWQHVAISKESGTYRIFINGISATFTGSISQAVNTGGNIIKIGALVYAGYPDYLTGYISNLRVVKGTAVYTSNFTPSKIPLTAITNTSLLLNTPYPYSGINYLQDSSTNAFTLTNNGVTSNTINPFPVTNGVSVSKLLSTGNLQVAGRYNEVVADVLPFAPSNGLPIISSSLITWIDPISFADTSTSVQSYAGGTLVYSLSNTSTINSSYPTTTLSSANTYTQSPNHVNYWKFPSSSETITIASTSASYVQPVKPNVNIWVKMDNWNNANGAIITCMPMPYVNQSTGWGLYAASTAGNGQIPAGNIGWLQRSTTTIPQGSSTSTKSFYYALSNLTSGWHMFTLNFGYYGSDFYLDGNIVASYVYTGGAASPNQRLVTSSNYTTIGQVIDTSTGAGASIGQILIYDVELSSSDITTLYNSRAGLYL